MTITIPDLTALAEIFPTYKVAWSLFLALSFIASFGYMLYCNLDASYKPKRGFAVMLLWAVLFLATVALYKEKPDRPQAVETSKQALYGKEVYITEFGLVCLKLTHTDDGSPVGLSCDWDQVLANNGKMLKSSRKMPEPLTSEMAKQQMQHAKPVVPESK